MKCLPKTKIPLASGVTLHDWHAEVLTLRAFNQFLLQECFSLFKGPPSPWVTWREDSSLGTYPSMAPFSIRDGIEIHMYCSEAPCGDASMELVMDEQDDSTPWTPAPPADNVGDEEDQELRGRAYFSQLGVVRTKPC